MTLKNIRLNIVFLRISGESKCDFLWPHISVVDLTMLSWTWSELQKLTYF